MAATPRVFVSLMDEGQEYQVLQGTDAQAAAARAGFEATILYAKRDPATQRRQIESAIQVPEADRPTAVVVHPVSVPALEPAAQAALAAGVGWVSLQSAFYLEALQRAHPTGLVAVMTTDGHEMGRIQARIFRALLPRGGSLVYVEGPALSPPVVHRREGMQDGLRGSGIEVTKTLRGDWSEESGEKAATLWLRLGRVVRPDLIGAQNDAMAAGVRKALQAWKPEWLDVPITGCDGLPNGGQRLVREKILAATVIQPNTAGAAVDLVVKVHRGQKVERSTSLPPRPFPPVEELERRARGG